MFAYCLFARSRCGATIGGGKADALCSREAGDLAMAHLRLPSCLRPRVGAGILLSLQLPRLPCLRPRVGGGLNDMEEKNCAIDFCPCARGGHKRICILDRFKIVSVRLRRAVLQGTRAEMVIALPSARAGTWRSDHGSFQAAFVLPSACGGSSRPSSRVPVFVLRPVAQGGAARGACGNGYSTSL